MTEQTVLSPRQLFQGHAAGPGRSAGPAYGWRTAAIRPAAGGDATLSPAERLQQACGAAADLLAVRIAAADAVLRPLLDAQRLMVDDPELCEGALALVQGGMDPAEAVLTAAGQLASVLEGADSAYFRDRAIDVRAAGKLITEMLAGRDAVAIPAGAVVLADELGPLDTAQLSEAGVAAMVTVRGGPTCHAAIVARAWGIPAVVGAPTEVLHIPEGTPVLIDGTTGEIIVHPTAADLAQPCAQVLPAVRLARPLPIYANIGSLAEVERARAGEAAGIGLVRTELLFQQCATAPTEDEQAAAYTEIVRGMAGRPVTMRTLDVGADKPLRFLPMPAEPNPQLGLRGIRYALRERAMFVCQLRALVRAATAGPLKIMLPMVTMPDEMREARALLDEAAAALNLPAPPLGAMIEVPMAALAADALARVSDFFSLGTNDLLQFLLAADRQHAGVGYLHAAEHPAVWGLIGQVITAAHAAGIPVGVCGEWGAEGERLIRLAELGIDSVSVAVGALPRVRALLPA